MTRKCFPFYMDYQEPLSELSDRNFRKVVVAMIRFACEESVEELRGDAKIAFGFIRPQMERDFKKYMERCETNRQNGRKGGVAKHQANASDRLQTLANEADTDTEAEADTKTDAKTDTVAEAVAEAEAAFFDDCPPPDDASAPPEPERHDAADFQDLAGAMMDLPAPEDLPAAAPLPDLPEEQSNAFEKPLLRQVIAYCKTRKSPVDPQRFFQYYESRGWRTGHEAIRDWRAALRSWEEREHKPVRRQNTETSYDGEVFDSFGLELPDF